MAKKELSTNNLKQIFGLIKQEFDTTSLKILDNEKVLATALNYLLCKISELEEKVKENEKVVASSLVSFRQ